ncbi:MAG: glycosyltransferase family 39 protein [Pirellulaceae bacterium]|nr:glycosyltransferase family 39 protein [Pirellulaceae bacterium]
MESPHSVRWLPRIALAAICLVGAGLRLWQAGESLWIDELHTAWCALGELREVAPRAALGNQSPLFFWLEWLLVRLLGPSEFTVRLPSLVAGSLLPLALFGLVVRWTKSPWLGVLSAALCAIDRFQIFYATEARPYTLIELLAVVHIGIVAELATSPASRKLRIAFILGAALLFYLHYTAALLVVAEVVYLVCTAIAAPGERSPRWRIGMLALDLALVGLLILPAASNLLAIYARRDNWAAFVEQRSVWTIFTHLPWGWACVMFIAGVVAHRWLRRTALPQPALLAVLWLLVPVSLAWFFTATDAARLYFPRYLVASAPAAIVLICLTLHLIPWPRIQVASASLLLVYALVSSQIIEQLRWDGRVIGDRNEDWRGAIAYLNQQFEADPHPVLLSSGLIEANHWIDSFASDQRDYCLYPLRSLYPVTKDAAPSLLPRDESLINRIDDLLDKHKTIYVVRRGIAYALLENGMYESKIPNRSWPRVPWRIEQVETFGSVQVVRLTTPTNHAAK